MGRQVDLDAEVPFNFWESRLMTDELMRAAAVDPSLWPEASAKIAKYDVNLRNGALAWQESAQLALKTIGPVQGFPSGALAVVVGNVGDVLTSVPDDPKQLGIQMAQIGVGVAMAVLAPIPIVGQVAAAVGAIAQFLLHLAAQEPKTAEIILPPLQDYSEEVDEWVVNNQVLPATGTLDWTGLFLPRYKGEWKAHDREAGFASYGAVSGGGAGFMPGTQRLSSKIQTYWLPVSERMVEASPEISASVRDTGSFYPGASQLMTALQEQVALPQSQLYAVDTNAILSAWEEYTGAALELASGIYKREDWAVKGTQLAKDSLAQNQALAQQMISPLLVGVGGEIGGFGTTQYKPWDYSPTVLERYIRPWCEKIRRRQWNNLGRIVGAAYTNEQQGAFRDPELLVRLRTMRAILLQHPARWDVDFESMIDPGFRSDLFDATIGQRLTAGVPAPKVAKPIDPDTKPDPPPPGAGGGVPFGKYIPPGKGPWVLLAGGLALAYWGRRKRWW